MYIWYSCGSALQLWYHSYMPAYSLLIIASWAVFLIVWALGAMTMKPDVKSRSGTFWFWRVVIIFLLVYLAERTGTVHIPNHLMFQLSPMAGWVGAALSIVGVAIAIWARVHLGRNWSSHPTFKTEHELVTSGPYAYVRHPIYTGVILALLGSVCIGYSYTLIIAVGVIIMFIVRIRKEERIMLSLFPDQYPPYQARTKKLIPFIW